MPWYLDRNDGFPLCCPVDKAKAKISNKDIPPMRSTDYKKAHLYLASHVRSFVDMYGSHLVGPTALISHMAHEYLGALPLKLLQVHH